MARRRRETPQGQVTFLAPDDAALLHLVRENLRLLSELRSSYRPTLSNHPKLWQVRCPQDVFDLLAPEMEALPQEQMRVVLLDTLRGIGTGQTWDLGAWASSPLETVRSSIQGDPQMAVLACSPCTPFVR